MSESRIRGCGTALVTPFTADGEVDEPALRALVDWQIEQGVHFLVPIGSTGEAATMSPEEQYRVVRIVVEQTHGRVPIIAGAGSNNTKRAVATSREMRDLGVTHLLHVAPMYNRPPQRGIIAHFRAIAEATDVPVVLYNVPGRTGCNIDAETALALAEVPNIVAIKEASGNMPQVLEILRHRPSHFSVLSGDDSLALTMMEAGGDGVVSVVSNATPRAMADLVNRCLAGDFAAARAIQERLEPWMKAAFIESNPIPVKAAMEMLGRAQNVLRLPLVPLLERYVAPVRESLVRAGAL
ncbi:MAG TPA: 4-hydroxy-tetrahydrodipicolinate synthase [Gemmatimonadaceae bacterium]